MNKPTETGPLLPIKKQTSFKLVNPTVLWILAFLASCGVIYYSHLSSQQKYQEQSQSAQKQTCEDRCRIQLVESIPDGLIFNSSVSHLSTVEAWSRLIKSAKTRIDIASMYWSLRGQDLYEDESDWAGELIYKQLTEGVNYNYNSIFNLSLMQF